jgi:serine/threonine-protein kinase
MSDLPPRLTSSLSDRYRIERELGAGGMATVYLAEDLKHGRKVAIKVLKPELAAVIGGERFLAEIKTTANLQHPNILPLHDSGEADSFLYYVMPYVEGETLRERIKREQQMGVEESVAIVEEVADALAYAHGQGIIHRDIKPANILIQGGRPVVADFGIALAVSAAGGGRLTETGLSLGTPHYMSPEQASADRELSARSDVYSLGCVLYEMLAGQPPHTGPNAQSVLIRILTDEPRPLAELRRSVPANVHAAVTKAIEKLPADRFASAADFHAALSDPSFSYEPVASAAVATRSVSTTETSRPGRRWLRWAVAVQGAAIIALLAALALMTRAPAQSPRPVMRFVLDSAAPIITGGLDISPDESHIVMSVASGSGRPELVLRRSADLQSRRLEGTLGGASPRFSPDGQWIGFVDISLSSGSTAERSSTINRIPVNGGPVQTIADGFSFDWGPDGLIWYTDEEGLKKVAPGGGSAELVLANNDSILTYFPEVLPGGEGVLFNASATQGGRVYSLDTRDGSLQVVTESGFDARYLVSGHVVYFNLDGTGSVVPFDVERLETTGSPVEVIEGAFALPTQRIVFAVSERGTFIQPLRQEYAPEERLAWVGVAGEETVLPIRPLDFEEPRVSPDGSTIRYIDFFGPRLILYDERLGTTTRLPQDIGAFGGSAMTPDGRALYVGGPGIFRVALEADEPSGATRIAEWAGQVETLSRDGEWIVLRQSSMERGLDISLVRVSDPSTLVPYLGADWDEAQASVSPDGRWLAYVSTQTGQPQVYVRSFPDPGPEVVISGEDAALSPLWHPDGSAIFYEVRGRMVRADLSAGDGVRVTGRETLFSTEPYESSFSRYDVGGLGGVRHDLHPDGERFLMVRRDVELDVLPVATVEVVLNWFEELKARMGEGY